MDVPDQEWVDLIDFDNRVLGKATRKYVRAYNLLHRGVGILVVNSACEVYVHKRTDRKDVFPGMFDMFVGGVVESGETYQAAAAREVSEELGIASTARLERLFRHVYDGALNRSVIDIFRVTWNGEIVHQEEEIAWGAWVPLGELAAWVDEHEIVPDGLSVYRHYLEWASFPGRS